MDVSRAGAQVLYGAHAGMLQTSRDGGRTSAAVGPAPVRLIDIATSPRDADTLFAATEAGLLRCTDRGATRMRVHPATAPVTLIDVGTDGRALAFVLDAGLVQAIKTTLDWTVVSDAFGDDSLLHLARDPANALRMFTVTAQAEMPTSHDGGGTWHHDDGTLTDCITRGGLAVLGDMEVAFTSGMPGFDAILDYIKSTWLERVCSGQSDRSRTAGG